LPTIGAVSLSFLLASFASSALADVCTDNLGAASASFRAARLKLVALEGASDKETCKALHDYIDIAKAARVVFDRCLTGTDREEMLKDANASISEFEPAMQLLCGD